MIADHPHTPAARGLALLLAAAATSLAAPIDYQRDVRPILSENCFACHGQDAAARKGKLRLDTREGQQKPGIIVPGKPDDSELVARIFSPYDDERMPAPESKRVLTEAQKQTLKRWIAEGAVFSEHWAFAPLRRPPVPGGAGSPSRPGFQTAHSPSAIDKAPQGDSQASRAKSPGTQAASEKRPHLDSIDAFIRAKLAAADLAPAPEADRERWLRRVTLDLTGLPPTIAEIDAFVADASSDAHAKVVDRLLASPRYGERMAADWLDAARYADTHGYQMDRARPMWPYRDWVIAAFNRNLSYDRFITEQLAGDLLPNATRDQRLATAFNRLHAQNEEGGIVDEEYRVAYVNDRVGTFGTAVLGLTLECARCHDHKFDPITQRDFYSLAAFFQNIDEAGAISYKGFSDIMPPPVLKLPSAAQERQLANLAERVARAEAAATTAREAAMAEFEAGVRAGRAGDLIRKPGNQEPGGGSPPGFLASEFDPPASGVVGAVVALDFDEIGSGGTPDAAMPGHYAKAVDDSAIGEGVRGGGALLNGDNGFAIGDAPVVTRGDAFSFSLWIRPGAMIERAVVFHRSMAYTDAGSRGYEMVLEQGHVAFALHRHWPGSSLKVVTLESVAADRWTHVTLTYDGSSRAAGARVYLDGVTAPVEVARDHLAGDITYDKEKQPPLLIGHRMRDSGFKGGRVDEFRMFARELTPLEAAELADRDELARAETAPAAHLTREQRAALKDHYVRGVAPAVRVALEDLACARRDYVAAYDAVPEVMVMEELPQPRPAFVLERGAYDRHGVPVTAGTPAALPALPKDAPRNRLGLARWATDPANPLTARVAVNRLWQMMFGRGLVETSDNFGVTGAVPTHPELLDWLAAEFVAGGWDIKALLREIALSRTYRQSSRASADAMARDPDNLLLARAPVRRLSAEMLRDQALAASGLLVDTIGGASVKPYQPPGLWEEIAMGRPKYDQGHGDELHRRSLYTFIKRTVPPPAMITFDATDRANCTVRRQTTSTPLQALALMNDVQLIEAARFIGARMLRAGDATLADQLRYGFRLVTSRTPTAPELATLQAAFAEQQAIFEADAAAAEKILAIGEARCDAAESPARLAAATMMASLLLNHDEAVMRR